MLNKVFLNGRLTSDVISKGNYGFCTIAVQRNYKNKEGEYDTDFIPVLIQGEKAISTWEKCFRKGDGVTIEGELRMVKDKDDEKKSHISIVVSFPIFGTAGVNKRNSSSASKSTAKMSTPDDEFSSTEDDDDLPF